LNIGDEDMKTIVAVASGMEEDAAVFAASARLASKFGGSVIVVPAFPDAAADYLGYGVALAPGKKAEALARVREAERELQTQIETAGRRAAELEGLEWKGGGARSFDVQLRSLRPINALKMWTPLADVAVFGADAARDPLLLAGLFAETLLSLHAPVLLIKEGSLDAASIGIAWDGSVQAARAVRAALPLLQMAASVFVLTNADEFGADAMDPEPIMRFLKDHGIANAAPVPVHGEDIAASLLNAARAKQCGLLVAGGYGRPRVVELVLGGTTRALVSEPGGPYLLLAH
jgi:nucleotide-binding universal stress UspA family protein